LRVRCLRIIHKDLHLSLLGLGRRKNGTFGGHDRKEAGFAYEGTFQGG